MTDASKAYINALLADATYITVTSTMNRDDIFDELKKRMTPALAQYIADNFEVLSAINTPDAIGEGSGFDATVWKGRAGTPFEGQVFVSTRGTEPDAGGQDFLADADLALGVAARAQIVDMVNWWLRETTPAGTLAKQIKNVATTTVYPGYPAPTTITENKIVQADTVTATGNLVGVTSVQVNGHSLGGQGAGKDCFKRGRGKRSRCAIDSRAADACWESANGRFGHQHHSARATA